MQKGGNAPIIVKRKKIIAGGGHHGGAWKVAYADFVTAMMAFFLMMWLLNATTEDQRKGLADYFSPDIPVARDSGGSNSMLGGTSAVPEDELNGARPDPVEESETLQKVDFALRARTGESDVNDDLYAHIATRVTDEGLIVDLFDLPNRPLFDGQVPTDTMRRLIAVVDDVFRLTDNRVAVGGHVGSDAVVLKARTVWPLSSARADAIRALLADGFTTERRIARVTGFADNQRLHPNPRDVRNNRIELILLRQALPR